MVGGMLYILFIIKMSVFENVFSYEYKYSPENNRKLTINLQFTM